MASLTLICTLAYHLLFQEIVGVLKAGMLSYFLCILVSDDKFIICTVSSRGHGKKMWRWQRPFPVLLSAKMHHLLEMQRS